MKQYLDVLRDVFDNGKPSGDRTGTGTIQKFGVHMEYDLQEGFPAVTTKKLAFQTMVTELLWFLRGDTDVSHLQEDGCKIWNEWQHEDKTIGPMYGYQWRNFNGEACDQLADVIKSLKEDPRSRRHVMTTFNPLQKNDGVLYPCHGLVVQFNVTMDGKLDCAMYQRSGDLFLGVPFNIASYALLTHIIAEHCGYDVGRLIITIGDAHIYDNHLEQVNEQLKRQPYPLPTLEFSQVARELIKAGNWNDLRRGSFILRNYKHHPAIKGKVSV